MNKPILLLLAALLLISIGNCATSKIAPLPTQTTLVPTSTSDLVDTVVIARELLSTEIEVYTTLFAERELFGSVSGTILVGETTIPYSSYFDEFNQIKVEIPTMQEETWQDFINQNYATYHFPNDLEFDRPTIFIKDGELDPIFEAHKNEEDGGWRTFYEIYPNSNGISSVSRVGLNATQTQAIVYVSHVCDVRCLTSALYVYEKQNNEWVRVGDLILGES